MGAAYGVCQRTPSRPSSPPSAEGCYCALASVCPGQWERAAGRVHLYNSFWGRPLTRGAEL
eukprot:scaffold735_cov376-Prasinococcus_capsulatus_cf.AAC.6